MKLRSVDFPNVFVASGTLNFFGDGWWYHRWCRRLFGHRFDFSGAGFISKTTTLNPRAGNMPLDDQLQPKECFPRCIKVYPIKGVALNAVGLSGPGAQSLLDDGRWQQRQKPFLISFMSLGETSKDRLNEAARFVNLLRAAKHDFQAPFGIQINVSCPNTQHATESMTADAIQLLEIFRWLGEDVPLDLKIGVADVINTGTTFLRQIQESGLCDCVTCSNTIPWGRLPYDVCWEDLFGTDTSPLEHLGGGGLSGKPLFPIVLSWLKNVRMDKINMPIKAGGGIMSAKDAETMLANGANAIEIGSVAMLRPWRVASIIKKANSQKGRE